MEKYLHAIGVIPNDEPTKDSKYIGKRSTSVSKAKEKEASDIEKITCLIESLTTKMAELKKRTSESTINSRTPRYPQNKNVASSCSSRSSQPTKSMESSNLVFEP